MTTAGAHLAEPIGIEARDVTLRFGRTTALAGLDLVIRPGTITGLLGRNGAGKSTFLALVAGLRRPTSGTVLVDGEDPFENPLAASRTQLVREGGDAFTDEKVLDTIGHYAKARPAWDSELAGRLLEAFEVSTRTKVSALSRGRRSALGVTIGLASRAPLTIFDETYLGMDAPSRYAFYDLLLADYLEHPRTFVVSSHLIDEIERLLEDAVILDRGRTLVAGPVDELRSGGATLTGPTATVEEVLRGVEVLARASLGGITQVTVAELDDAARARALSGGLELGPVGLQDYFVHLTRTEES